MIIKNKTLEYKTKGEYEFEDVTEAVFEFVKDSGVKNGLVNVQTLHTTAAVIVNENEPLFARLPKKIFIMVTTILKFEL